MAPTRDGTGSRIAKRHHSLKSLAAVLVVGLMAASGCAITPTFTTGYRVQPRAERDVPLSATLAVRRFTDQRPPRIYTAQGKIFLVYVPLIPYVSLEFERLDETVPLLSDQIADPGTSVSGAIQNRAPDAATYAFPTSMAKAVANDLGAHGLFRSVTYTEDETAGNYDYVLTGILRSTESRTSTTSYCLGLPGVYLWLLPIPMMKTTASVVLDLTLTDTRTGDIVWARRLTPEVSRYDNFYTSEGIIYGGSVFSYQMVLPPADADVDRDSIFAWQFAALRLGMIDAEPSLVAALASR